MRPGRLRRILLRDSKIKKRKGHLVITDRYPGFLRHQLVELGYLKERALGDSAIQWRSMCSRGEPARF